MLGLLGVVQGLLQLVAGVAQVGEDVEGGDDTDPFSTCVELAVLVDVDGLG